MKQRRDALSACCMSFCPLETPAQFGGKVGVTRLKESLTLSNNIYIGMPPQYLWMLLRMIMDVFHDTAAQQLSE